MEETVLLDGNNIDVGGFCAVGKLLQAALRFESAGVKSAENGIFPTFKKLFRSLILSIGGPPFPGDLR